MQFNSIVFIFLFFPVSLIIFLLMKKKENNNLFLLFISFIFYFRIESNYAYVIILTVIINYCLGLLIERNTKNRFRKYILLLGITINIAILIFYKYSNFILDNLNPVLKYFNVKPVIIQPIHLPLGISFFIFISISYLIDVYWNRGHALKNIGDLGLYIGFFPKVINGPITLFHKFSDQIIKRKIGDSYYSTGIRRFIVGFGKKVLIADTLAVVVDKIFNIEINSLGFGLSWFGIILYSLQIYYDFSGYTDMAIGIGYMFGFKIPENFNYPYLSRSIRDFWKRWHITLGQWLQLYLFLPIAYAISRKIRSPKFLKIRAESWAYFTGTFITMLICGIWHGAQWTFVVWGIYHGLFLILEHLKIGKWLKRKSDLIKILYSLIVIVIGWVIFRSKNLTYSFGYLSAMFGNGSGDNIYYYPALYMNIKLGVVIVIALLGSFPFIRTIDLSIKKMIDRYSGSVAILLRKFYSMIVVLIQIAIFILSILQISNNTFNPFIYFRF